MGTWDAGLLDNDTALDGLGDLSGEVVEDIVRFGAMKPTATSTARLAAAVGVLLQLSAYDFRLDTDSGPAIVAALAAHLGALDGLPARARTLLRTVAEGGGEALGDRSAKLGATVATMMNAHRGEKDFFGKREPSLFASKAAAAYVQSVAKRCVARIDEDLEDEDNASDLAREGYNMGCLAVLLVLDPIRLSPAKLKRWRRTVAAGLATLEQEGGEELPFHRAYYANVERVLARLGKHTS